MRQGLDWYKRDPRAFIDGVQGLGPELIGAYAVILDLIYARGGSTIADPRHLAGVMGCSLRKARALVEGLIEAGKITEIDGEWTNKRASNECETALKLHRKLAESGAKGGRKSGENRSETNENNDLSEATLKHIRVDKNKNTPLTPQGGRKRKVPIPEDWTPSQADIDHAKGKGLTQAETDAEAERFRNHAIANSRLFGAERGISAAWRNWIASPYRKPSPPSASPASQQSFFTEADRQARDRLLGKKPELARVA